MKGFADARVMGKVSTIHASEARTALTVMVGLRDGAMVAIAVSLVSRAHGADIRVEDEVLVWGELRAGGEIWIDEWGECRVVTRHEVQKAPEIQKAPEVQKTNVPPVQVEAPPLLNKPVAPMSFKERIALMHRSKVAPGLSSESTPATEIKVVVVEKIIPVTPNQTQDEEFLIPAQDAHEDISEPEEFSVSSGPHQNAKSDGRPGDSISNPTGGLAMRRAPMFLSKKSPPRPAPAPQLAPAPTPVQASRPEPDNTIKSAPTPVQTPVQAPPVQASGGQRFISSRKSFRTTRDEIDVRASAITLDDLG